MKVCVNGKTMVYKRSSISDAKAFSYGLYEVVVLHRFAVWLYLLSRPGVYTIIK